MDNIGKRTRIIASCSDTFLTGAQRKQSVKIDENSDYHQSKK